MTEQGKPKGATIAQKLRSVVVNSPWNVLAAVARVLWGFHVEGKENIPAEGPYIVSITEQGLLGTILSGYISIVLLNKELDKHPKNALTFFQEDLFAISYFRSVNQSPKSRGKYRALLPHAAGQLSASLLEAYRVLLNKGLVILNPEGDASYDGRPMPIGAATPWMALRAAAPILPVLTTIGVYEVFPRWSPRPSRKGRIKVVIGKPLKLAEQRLERVTDQDIADASAKIRAEYDRIIYGPQGLDGWIGPVMRNNVTLSEPPKIEPPAMPLAPLPPPDPRMTLGKHGLAQVLWQCPVCRTNASLLHRRPRFKPQTLACQACGTQWELTHQPGHDFRLKVVRGSDDLLGLDMPASTWYQEMNKGFRLNPIRVEGVALKDGEVVYLQAQAVKLVPHRPNPLFDSWTSGEAPRSQGTGRHQLADWASLGEGKLLLTDQRLYWQGPQGELDFYWQSVNAVYLFLADVLGIKYQAAQYRFKLAKGLLPLEWLHHAGEMAKKAAAVDGHHVTVSHH